ncbi:MAG TPA: porin [Sphingobium sp.]|uniref:OprO/OprP family phosphate-selective porin n=1 Tax=Sphingobium sp. TaxID=1912891 RepID=UPI002ED5BF45
MTKATLLTGTAGLFLAAAPIEAQPSAASPQEAAEIDERAQLRAEVSRLKETVARLEARLDKMEGAGTPIMSSAPTPTGVQGQLVQSTPSPAAAKDKPTEISWKGSPQFAQGDAKFKVKGRIQFDANYLATAPLTEKNGTIDRSRGFSNEVRRIRLGGEGNLGSGFGYKLELELSDNQVDLVDTFITYQKGKWLLTLGNQNSFQSLDELIGDTSGTVMERAAFTDAFNFERRLGFSAQYQTGPWLLQAGAFTDSVDSLANSADGVNGGDENNSVALDGRVVFAPKVGKGQLHFGGSYHWRDLGRLVDGTQQYRQRPYIHSSNSRILAVSLPGVGNESHYGLETAGIFGRWHYAGETHWLHATRPTGTDPTFFGAYGEVGFFLTPGDSRPYSNGTMGTPKPAHPFGKGGPGAIQLTLRYDYLTLNDRRAGIVGGTQNGIITGLVWTPIQYLRFNMNYAHLSYTDAAILAGGRSDHDANVVGLRAELDF